MTPDRQLVYDFLNLPIGKRLIILREMNIIESGSEHLVTLEKLYLYIKTVMSQNRNKELREMIDKNMRKKETA